MIQEIEQQLLGIAEIGGNHLLGMDLQALKHCEDLQGHIIAIHLTDLEKTVYFHPGSWGIRLSIQQPTKAVDATIRGRLVALINLSQNNAELGTSSQEHLEIIGNTSVAQQFQKVLTELNINWEQQLSRLTGENAASGIAKGIKETHQWILEGIKSTVDSSCNSLQKENTFSPTFADFQHFSQGVTEVTKSVDRIEALLNHLQTKK